MGRKTQYNRVSSPEKLALINKKNIKLKQDFLDYLRSIQRAQSTIDSYSNDLDIVFVFLLEQCDNKDFVAVKKKEWAKFQNWLIDDHGNSAARVRRIKATVSSMSKYITDILADDEPEEYGAFRNTIKAIENPVNQPAREKTVLTEEECQNVLDTLIERGDYEKVCLFALAKYSGRRKQELFRFKVSHFDDENLVYGCLYRTPEKVRSKGRGRNGKLLNFFVLKDFKPYLDMWLADRERRGITSEWVFPDKADPSQPRDYKIANSWANTISAILGRDFYWHSMRHFWTSALAQQNIPDDVIQALQGWSSDMVKVYKDFDVMDDLGKYFGEEGIKQVEQATLADL